MNDDPLSHPDPENLRTEYAAVHEYHGQLVNSRFTIAGLYVAAIGFLAGAVLGRDTAWPARASGSVFALWLTLCLWILELRSRALFENIAHRAIEIEHRHWGLTGRDWYAGLFSRQYKLPPPTTPISDDLPRRREPDRPRLGWSQTPMSVRMSRFISHSLGLDLLYAGSGVFWIALLLVSVFRMFAL